MSNKVFFSKAIPVIKDIKGRERIANQLEAIIKIHFKNTKKSTCLDIGCSTGVVTFLLSRNFDKTIGIDVDKDAVKTANRDYRKKKLIYKVMDAERTTFKDNYFDAMIINQGYECVDNQNLLAKEMYRILKPGGICLVGARNKISFVESITRIPLIHFLPEKVAEKITRMFGKNYYHGNYLTLFGLYKLFHKFDIENITSKIIVDSTKYKFVDIMKYRSIIRFIPKAFIDLMMPLIPNFFLLLRKV